MRYSAFPFAAIARRFRFDSSLALGMVAAIGLILYGSSTIALPGTQPTPVGLVILVAAAAVALAPSTMRLLAYERQSDPGCHRLRVLGMTLTMLSVAPAAITAVCSGLSASIVLVWLAAPLSVGFLFAGLLGDGVWAVVMLVGLVAFTLAGQVDQSGDHWFVTLTAQREVAIGSGLLLGASLWFYLHFH